MLANRLSELDGLEACYALEGCDEGELGAGLVCDAMRVTSPTGHPKDCVGWRMPTEAEWDLAARAGTDSLFAGGQDIADVGWSTEHSGSTTHEPCQKAPNAFGLCDMPGNLWEMTSDWFADYLAEDAVDPIGPSTGDARVSRGGSYSVELYRSRVSMRCGGGHEDRPSHDLGVRYARSADAP